MRQAVVGDSGRRVLPLHRDRLRDPVPARAAARRRQARTRLGVDSRERAGGARRRRQHHAVQALGLRARVLRDRCRGCLLAAQVGVPRAITFQTQDSLTLAATALIGGIYSLWGAIVAGVFQQGIPFLFQAQWGINPNFVLIIFGAGLLQVLLTAPGGLADQLPEGSGRLGGSSSTSSPAAARAGRGGEEGAVIEVKSLTVRFAGVTPLDDVSVVFPGGTCGLIGPNGAGKTTFFNVLSGFVRPAKGAIRGYGEDLLAMADFRRARWGLRRTFQTEQAIEKLSVFDNVAMIHEHSAAKRATRRADVLDAIEFVGLDVSPKTKVGGLGAGERRLVELARAVVGKPRVVLLDEPAAGLPQSRDGADGRSDPEDPGAVRRARHPRRPRHGARLRLLRDDGRARLRQADRVGPDGRGPAERARDARVSRHGGGALSTPLPPRKSSRSPARAGRSSTRSRSRSRGTGDDAPRRERRRQVVARARDRGPAALDRRTGAARRSRPDEPPPRADPLGRRRRRPRGPAAPAGLTVEENLRVATYSLGTAQAKQGIAYALELFPELERRWGATARLLSGGEQQMVVLAQALVSQPKIVLVDELSLGLAPVVVKRLVPTLESAAANGVGVLLIEQFAHVALGLAETAYVIERGRIRYAGPAQKLKDEPELLHSAYLLAESAVPRANPERARRGR